MTKKFTKKADRGFDLKNHNKKQFTGLLDLAKAGMEIEGKEFTFNTDGYGEITVHAKSEAEARQKLAKEIDLQMRLADAEAKGLYKDDSIEKIMEDFGIGQ